MCSNHIKIQNAKVHNLKNINISVPRDKFVVFTGLSGSGKSSLAFDTIFAEGQRRYMGSLNSYARQYLDQLDKPDVDKIEGLPPTISIEQKTTTHNKRSTVGTITEIYDYLRLMYSAIGKPHCPECGDLLSKQSPEDIINRILELEKDTKIQILSPVVRNLKGEHKTVFNKLKKQGYERARVNGKLVSVTNPPALSKSARHDIEIIMGEVVISKTPNSDISELVKKALVASRGYVLLNFLDLSPDNDQCEKLYSEHLACAKDDISFDQIATWTFSFNSPYGACPDCTGLGTKMNIIYNLVVPDENKTLNEGAVDSIATSSNTTMFLYSWKAMGIDLDKPWKDLPEEQRYDILHGEKRQLLVPYINGAGGTNTYRANYESVYYSMYKLYSETKSEANRKRIESYMREDTCDSCYGTRLKKSSLSITINDKSIAEITNMSLTECLQYMKNIDLSTRDMQIAKPVIKEIVDRLQSLADVGLGYLTLSRRGDTLSGGEMQRIKLVTQIQSGLVNVLYVLDEPSIGLHPKDNKQLIQTLIQLKDSGNSLIVVEHDEETIRAADWIVEIGPGAGEYGGNIIMQGTVEDMLRNPNSLTGAYLSGKQFISVPAKRRAISNNKRLVVKGARENNLKGINAEIPLGCLVAVTGVSGSGKSTLINDVLYNAIAQKLHGAEAKPGKHDSITGMEHIDKVVHIDQTPIGRSPRSNPATYTGVFDHIRDLFAATEDAKVRKYKANHFSFNVKGGRCEECNGDGVIRIDMQFMPDAFVQCDACQGTRYTSEALGVYYKNKNIADVLSMSIEEAAEFFQDHSNIHKYLQILVNVGLGYMRLGQPATTLSGGEAQRIKLASELYRQGQGHTLYMLDEPTTGLHFEDVRKLSDVLNKLVDAGNSVIVIEHNLDIIKTADWVIDIGPEGGELGGSIVAEGTPEAVAKVKASYTGQFLKLLLN